MSTKRKTPRTKHLNVGRPVANKNKVPKKQWDKWSRQAQKVFNLVYRSMRPSNQHVYHHPEAPMLAARHWQTVRWNASWIAADAVDDGVLVK